MKTKIVLIATLLLSGLAWGQEKDPLKEFIGAVEKHQWEDKNKDSQKFFLRLLNNELDGQKSIKEQKEYINELLEILKKEELEEKSKSFLTKELEKRKRLLEKDYSSGKTYDIELNFRGDGSGLSEEILVPRRIKKGDYYRILVSNINPNRYFININSEDSTRIGKIDFPTFSDINLETLQKLTAGFNDVVENKLSATGTESNPTDILNGLKANFKLLNNSYQESVVLLNQNIDKEQQKKEFDAEKYFEELKAKHQGILRGLKFILAGDKEKVTILKNKVVDFRNERFKKLPNPSQSFNYSKFLEIKREIKKEIDSSKQKITKAKGELIKEVEDNYEFFNYLSKDPARKKQVEKLKTAYSEALVKNSEILALVSDENVEKMLSSVRFLHTGKNEYLSASRQYNNDLEKVNIDFVPKDSAWGLQKRSVSNLVFPANPSSYWSLGTSFYYSNLSNERFSTLTTVTMESDTVYTLKREDNNEREAGVALMLRFGKKLDKNGVFGIHGSLGPGVSIEKSVRPRILFGIGASYGKKHNIIFDWGGILGYVDRRSSIVVDGAEFFEKPEPTITKMMIGNYFSLGYMFRL